MIAVILLNFAVSLVSLLVTTIISLILFCRKKKPKAIIPMETIDTSYTKENEHEVKELQ